MASERQGAGTLFENPLSRCAGSQTFGLCFPSFFGLTPHSGKGRKFFEKVSARNFTLGSLLHSFTVAPAHGHLVANLTQALPQQVQALRRLGPRVELVVVQGVLLPGVLRGQVGHHHIGPMEDALLPAAGQQRAQSGGGGQQHPRQQQPDNGQQQQGQLPAAVGEIPEGRVLLA